MTQIKKYYSNDEFIKLNQAYLDTNCKTLYRRLGQDVCEAVLKKFANYQNFRHIARDHRDRVYSDLFITFKGGAHSSIDTKFRLKNARDFRTMIIDEDNFYKFVDMKNSGKISTAYIAQTFRDGVFWVADVFNGYTTEQNFNNEVTLTYNQLKVEKTSYAYKPMKIYYFAWQLTDNIWEPIVSDQPINVNKLNYDLEHPKSYELF